MIVRECDTCGHVAGVESALDEVSCVHGGEWIPMPIAADQETARAKLGTQTPAWLADTTDSHQVIA